MTVCTWCKLPDGSWGIRGPQLRSGRKVVVKRRDGNRQVVTVGSIVRGTHTETVATVAVSTREPLSLPPRAPRRVTDEIQSKPHHRWVPLDDRGNEVAIHFRRSRSMPAP